MARWRGLNDLGVEIHARSLFLQGLLFLGESAGKTAKAPRRIWRKVQMQLREAGITPLAAALGFVLSRPEIAFGLVGVTSARELEDIIAAARVPLPDLDWASFALDDETDAYAVALVSAPTTRLTSAFVMAGNIGKVRIWRDGRFGHRTQARLVAQPGIMGMQIDRRIMDIGADAVGAQPGKDPVAVDPVQQPHDIEMIGVGCGRHGFSAALPPPGRPAPSS